MIGGARQIPDTGGINGCSSEAAIWTHTIQNVQRFELGLGWAGEETGVGIRITPRGIHLTPLSEGERYLG